MIAALLLLAAARAHPASDHAGAVQAALDDDAGWEVTGESRGVTVSRKVIPDLGLTAFKGERVLEAGFDTDRLFTLVCDIAAHIHISETLDASTVVGASGEVLHFYQVMEKAPMVPVARRYWFVHSVIQRDVGGVEGHYKRTWDALAPELYPEARSAVAATFTDAVEVTENHGSWEIRPRPDGSSLFIYRAVSNPGGAVPDGVFKMLTSRTLPSNMLNFVEAASAGE